MQSTVCCCCKKIVNNKSKDIFEDDLNLKECQESRGPSRSAKRIKLNEGIQLIVGHKIHKSDKEHKFMCDECLKKLESCIDFKLQLLTSLKTLLRDEDLSDVNCKSPEIPLATGTSTNLSALLGDELVPENKDKNNENVENDLGSHKSTKTKICEDIINVDENSIPMNFNPLNDECGTYDTVDSSNQQNDPENNNLTHSENSSDTLCDNDIPKENLTKVQDNDIESEIDVCSGEDDEVLELDIQNRKNETVEIESSSESDIEVCDYEPTGKRNKNYNTLSPSILF